MKALAFLFALIVALLLGNDAQARHRVRAAVVVREKVVVEKVRVQEVRVQVQQVQAVKVRVQDVAVQNVRVNVRVR